MQTKRMIVAAAITAVSLAGAAPAFAGEYNGNGKFVPGGENGKSICSYSGLDEPDELEATFPDDDLWLNGVQNYGQLVRQGLKNADFVTSPGLACRGNAGGH